MKQMELIVMQRVLAATIISQSVLVGFKSRVSKFIINHMEADEVMQIDEYLPHPISFCI